MHLAINHSFGPPWLRGLLDVHLLIQEQLLQWEPVVARARAWRLATVVWVVLDLARLPPGTAVPDEVLAAVALPVGRRWVLGRLSLDRALLERWPGGSHPAAF
ncbi:MAG: nucleotidyltransferase family protein [Ardenticatenaceae bacterium]|nr:nucleotidyltransferase family protein [Ardenticatenaceae bacterium]